MMASTFFILERAITAKQGRQSFLALAVGDWKDKLSLYSVAIPLAFLSPWISIGLYLFVAPAWFIPDPRIERVLEEREK